jgi:hypothetical protein
MRPRLLKTLKDLKDFIAQAERWGARPTDAVYFARRDDAETLDSVTAIYWEDQEHGGDFSGPGFFTLEYWTPEELYGNAIHNDELGTEDHFVS